MNKILLSIDGMTCSACSNGLEKYLNKQDGVIDASVNLVMATASVTYEDNLSISDLERFVREAGFKSLGEANLYKEENYDKKPFIIFGFLAFILMYISMAPMLHLPTLNIFDMMKFPICYSLVLLFLTIPFLIFGRDIIISGIKNVIHKMPNMDTLVSIGVFSSFIYSIFNIILIFLGYHKYVHHLYFESTAFVLYFIKLGRFIDKSSKGKTKDAIKKLVVMTPKNALLKDGDGYKEVTIDLVKKDDVLVCLPGGKIAVDGVIVDGNTHIDESFITGESKPVLKKKDDNVVAGSINFEGKIFYKAKRIGKDSTISEIVKLVLDATNTKAPIALLADKISGYFVPLIIVLAFITLFGNMLFGCSFSIALNRFVTVLVVACPCALGLATPLAIVVSEGNLARKGILVKDSKVFELGNKIDTIVFDKTGILTNGKLMISKFYNYSKLEDKDVLQILGNIEYSSSHPIAKGVITSLGKNFKYNSSYDIEDIPGYGIKAKYKDNIYYACNGKMIEKLNISNIHKDDDLKLQNKGNSIIYIVKNNDILGIVGIKDLIREESKNVVNTLISRGYDVIMLTGDNKETANRIAKDIGITNVISSVVPREKANVIKELNKSGKSVIMVGDGINDAPSLSLSDIGISISSGTDIATDSALVILMNDNLNNIIDLLDVCKKTLLNIKENLFWAFIYNISMIPIAMGLFSKFNFTINPMIACIAMICSSLFVIFNALRLKK